MEAKRLIAFVCAVALLVTLMGCNSGAAQHRNSQGEPYPEDGYQGYTNSNPNLLPLRQNQSKQTYSQDQHMIRNTLGKLGHEDFQVIFRGGTIRITLRLSDDLPEEEILRIEEEARQAVQYELPRYRIQLTSNQHLRYE